MIEVVMLPRAEGKTRRILEWAAESTDEDRRVIVAWEDEARRLAEISGLPPDRFVTIGDVLNRGIDRHSGRPLAVAVDNLDTILHMMFGRVSLVTLTEDGI